MIFAARRCRWLIAACVAFFGKVSQATLMTETDQVVQRQSPPAKITIKFRPMAMVKATATPTSGAKIKNSMVSSAATDPLVLSQAIFAGLSVVMARLGQGATRAHIGNM